MEAGVEELPHDPGLVCPRAVPPDGVAACGELHWGQKRFPAPGLCATAAKECEKEELEKPDCCQQVLSHRTRSGAPLEKPENLNKAWKAPHFHTHLLCCWLVSLRGSPLISFQL